MKNERLIELRELQRPDAWPTHYVVTDKGPYEYTGQAFVKSPLPTTSLAVGAPEAYLGRIITDIRGDGESAVVQLEGGDLIVFELLHAPFGTTVESHPTLRFVSADEAAEWRDDYDSMDPL